MIIEMDSILFGNIIETYKCLLSCRTKLPGMKLEDALTTGGFQEMKEEFEWIRKTQEDNVKKFGQLKFEV